MENLSLLMHDSSESDGKAEIVMDYVLSYSLRMAEDKYSVKPKLNKACRKMLERLLDKDLNGYAVTSVEVWKEWNRIDLVVDVIIQQNNDIEHHAILIENKYYTGLHDSLDVDGAKRNQLEVYKKKFDAHYMSDSTNWQTHYKLITCIERNESSFCMYDIAPSFGFDVITFEELVDKVKDTESDIFNEFWLRNW